MKTVTNTLGVARSNIAERVRGVRPKRGPQTRDSNLELAAEIRRLVDAHPTYGCHDHEVMGWVATTVGISGEMIRNLMVECVETRFAAPRVPHRIQWLTDNGSTYAAGETVEVALALNLAPCFTPVESPEATAWPSRS